jgi:sugar/nucleoside kinase (ribokinase family)
MTTHPPPEVTLAGPIYIDLPEVAAGEATGAKRSVRYKPKLGGAIANVLRALSSLGLRVHVHSVLHPAFAEYAASEVRKLGGRPYIVEREDALALSVIRHSARGGSEVAVHRPVIRYEDLTAHGFAEHAGRAALTVVGAIADPAQALPMMRLTVRMARLAVAIPHPHVLTDPKFPKAARHFAGVIFNANEARKLTPGQTMVEFSALKLRHETGHQPEIVITDAERPVTAWADLRWHRAQPRPVGQLRHDVGAGDTFSARYAYYRFVRGLPAEVALESALDAVAAFLRQQAVASAAAQTAGVIPKGIKPGTSPGVTRGGILAALRTFSAYFLP